MISGSKFAENLWLFAKYKVTGFPENLENLRKKNLICQNFDFARKRRFWVKTIKISHPSSIMGFRHISLDMKECGLRLWEAGWSTTDICCSTLLYRLQLVSTIGNHFWTNLDLLNAPLLCSGKFPNFPHVPDVSPQVT